MSTPTLEPERTAITPAAWVPGYELLTSIGSGGFGVVFKAQQLALDRVVAIKLIRFDTTLTADLVARFQAEAITLAKLRHPNIVHVYDYGQHEGRLFIAMELLEGEDLGQLLSNDQPLDERVAWAIARQTASALAHAAEHGVIHRDVKPANLFLVPPPIGSGWPRDVPLVKVLDFGLSRTRRQAMEESDVRLTQPNAVPGTPLYMAPEQHRKAADLDHRADVFALGASTFHAIVGRPPFPGPTVWDLMLQKLDHKLKFAPDVSPESRDLLTAMLTPDPAHRVKSYAELIARIEQLPIMQGTERRSTAPPTQRPVSPSRSPLRFVGRRWKSLAAAGLITTTGLGIGIWADQETIAVAPTPPDQYGSNGVIESLFDNRSVSGWLPPSAGGTWATELDDEGLQILSGSGFTRRLFSQRADYRVTIGLDVHAASATEVHFAIPAAAPDKGRRFVLRVTKANGATFGTREGDKGTFQPIGTPVPFPRAGWFEGRRPYLEVKVEKAGGRWTTWFHGTEAGLANDDGEPKSPEVRLAAEGGNIHVDSVSLTTLKKQ